MTRRVIALSVLMLLTTLGSGRLATPPVSQAQSGSTVVLRPVISGLVEPLYVTSGRDGSGRLYVVEKGGTIRVLVGGQIPATPYLDVRSQVVTVNEQGLLGLAFDPAFAVNRRAYVYYTVAGSATGVGDDTLARYQVSATDANRLEPTSGTVLLAVADPFVNHNGGMMAFGPDGYLYVALGDGGSAGDPSNNAQNLGSLLGKLLRLDVSGSGAYAIPSTNPYAPGSVGTRGEIWASGLRNPWRFSFDRGTGDLYIGDVGQSSREEIDFQPAGAAGGRNYGWRTMEGFLCFNPSSGCSQAGLTLPIYDYARGDGCSVTGGYVYRGAALSALQGAYIYGDYCSGIIWALRRSGASWTRTQLLDTPYFISSFGEDEAGELYVIDLVGGTVYKLADPSSPAPAVAQAPALPPAGSQPTPTTPPSTGADLVVTAFTVGNGTSDQAIPISATVSNRGEGHTGPGAGFDVHVFADLGRPPTPSDVAFVGHLAFPPLAPGVSSTVTGTLFAGALAPGAHTLWALADGHGTVGETDEANNSASMTINVGSPAGSQQTVTFDDKSGQNQALNGQYPSGLINWGTGSWYHSAPWQQFTTKSVSFDEASLTSGSFTLLTPRVLVGLGAYNGGTAATTITLSCAGQPTVTTVLAAKHLATISTGWTGPCTTITIGSTNGWNTNFDNLVLASPSASTPTATATATATPIVTTCAPRPRVAVSVETIGTGLLRVTVAATTSSGTPTNALQELRFGAARNALIQVSGQSHSAGNTVVPLAQGTSQATFVVQRLSPGAVTVPLSAIDACGEWRTFVGGGPNAF